MKYLLGILLIVGSVSWVLGAEKRKQRVYYLDFQDEFIEGHVKNPTIFHLFNKQQLEYDSLVDLRKDFLPELRRTAGEID